MIPSRIDLFRNNVLRAEQNGVLGREYFEGHVEQPPVEAVHVLVQVRDLLGVQPLVVVPVRRPAGQLHSHAVSAAALFPGFLKSLKEAAAQVHR